MKQGRSPAALLKSFFDLLHKASNVWTSKWKIFPFHFQLQASLSFSRWNDKSYQNNKCSPSPRPEARIIISSEALAVPVAESTFPCENHHRKCGYDDYMVVRQDPALKTGWSQTHPTPLALAYCVDDNLSFVWIESIAKIKLRSQSKVKMSPQNLWRWDSDLGLGGGWRDKCD